MATAQSRPVIEDEERFRVWLHHKKGLQGRSLGDVVSRLRRVATWINLLDKRTDPEVVFWLTQDARFDACSANVKSQMKRALQYYRSFRNESSKKL